MQIFGNHLYQHLSDEYEGESGIHIAKYQQHWLWRVL
jgi:hypothetical protein